MISRVLGASEHFVVSGDCGIDYQDELRELKRQLKKQNKTVRSIVVVKAIVFTEDIDKEV